MKVKQIVKKPKPVKFDGKINGQITSSVLVKPVQTKKPTKTAPKKMPVGKKSMSMALYTPRTHIVKNMDKNLGRRDMKDKSMGVSWWNEEKVSAVLRPMNQEVVGMNTWMANLPNIGSRGPATVVKHRDYLAVIPSSDTFIPVVGFAYGQLLNPVKLSVPWLSRFAMSFTYFSVDKARLVYSPSCATNTSGALLMGWSHDSRTPTPLNIRNMSLCTELARGPVTGEIALDLKNGPMGTLLRIDDFNMPIVHEQTAAGILFMSIYGGDKAVNGKPVGDVFLEYEISFYYPRPFQDPLCSAGGTLKKNNPNISISANASGGNDLTGVKNFLDSLKTDDIAQIRGYANTLNNLYKNYSGTSLLNGKVDPVLQVTKAALSVITPTLDKSGVVTMKKSDTAVDHYGIRFNVGGPMEITFKGSYTFTFNNVDPFSTNFFGSPLVVHPESKFANGINNQYYLNEPLNWLNVTPVVITDKNGVETNTYLHDIGFETKLMLHVSTGDEIYFYVPYVPILGLYAWYGYVIPGESDYAYENGFISTVASPNDISNASYADSPWPTMSIKSSTMSAKDFQTKWSIGNFTINPNTPMRTSTDLKKYFKKSTFVVPKKGVCVDTPE